MKPERDDLELDGPGSGKRTLIEEGTEFRGSFDSKCPIVVKGRIEGEIRSPSLTVSASGAVEGKVEVDELRSEGELSGEYDADRVVLSGTVKDNTVIRARSLEVKLAHEGGKMQVVFGDCELEVGDVPDKAEAVAEAAGTSGEDGPSGTTGPATSDSAATAAARDATAEASAVDHSEEDADGDASEDADAGDAEDTGDDSAGGTKSKRKRRRRKSRGTSSAND